MQLAVDCLVYRHVNNLPKAFHYDDGYSITNQKCQNDIALSVNAILHENELEDGII